MSEDRDKYLIAKSKDSSEWKIVAERNFKGFLSLDNNKEPLVVVATLNNVSWQTAKAVMEVLLIDN